LPFHKECRSLRIGCCRGDGRQFLHGRGRKIAKEPVLAMRAGHTTLDNFQAIGGAHEFTAPEYNPRSLCHKMKLGCHSDRPANGVPVPRVPQSSGVQASLTVMAITPQRDVGYGSLFRFSAYFEGRSEVQDAKG
jgi:hypothetical protein